MKLAAVVDSKLDLKPLDQGERIVLFSDDGSIQQIVQNPGYGFKHGGKEQAMETILSLGAQAVAVGEQFLCPCTYRMSKGKLLYVPAAPANLEEIKKNYPKLTSSALQDVDPGIYYEEPHAHDNPKSTEVNTSLRL